MKLKTFFMTALAALSFQSSVHAGEAFDEMTYTPEQTVFKLNAPVRPVLRLYNAGTGGKLVKTVKLRPAGKNLWAATVKGDLKGCFYTFDMGKGQTPGVFAKAVGVNGARGAVIDMASTNPQGWETDRRPATKSPADLVVYEMHHRDFSIDASSGLQHKGKFLALTEPGAIAHLKELGVNAIHILPSFDYASVDESHLERPQYNWGYDPLNYNVPEGSYSTDPYTPAVRIREFKQMVQALHKAGIRVILDVVYNHTFDLKGSNFERTYPGYYYRYKADGTPSDGSGCGNETASEQPLMRRFMIESVKYWINEYHIDGFRFDLMGIHDIETMRQIRAEVNKIDPTIFIYGEGWSAGTCAYPQEKLAMKANMKQLPGIAAFSDEMRDALRGPFSDDSKGGFLARVPGTEESLKFGIVGGVAHPQVDMSKVNYSKEVWANEPTQMVAYVSCHDDMCLTDRLRASIPGISTDELVRLDLLAQTAVFTSQGVPFILSGEEMLRDKKGVHNSFNAPDSINHLDWNNLKKYPQVFDYYKGLIRLRKAHPAFRLGKAGLVRDNLRFLSAPAHCVAYCISNRNVPGEEWNNTIVILNAGKEAAKVAVPEGKYTIVAKEGVIIPEGMGEMEGSEAFVAPQSALIIHD
ncbi:MAG: type I pullulanase [Prevotella buccae]|uniref:type I pullulanase n=1 Tax=Segatella buccae TaxID=28126 RepID=UPI0005875D9F|nr:type I pullulanase [Segatella buccae]MBS5895947.1 type I pullulanase [Segatella buccae]